MAITLLVVVAIAVALALVYNQLAQLRLLADNAWADIDVQLKRRHDLIPSLVAAVQGHAGYEKGTLEAVVAARNRATEVSGPRAAGDAEQALSGEVRRLFALAEAYPDLKAAGSFLSLQKALSEIEDQIQSARRYYNAVVRDFNTKIAQFPSNLVATGFGFRPREFFGLADDAERAVPTVDLGPRS